VGPIRSACYIISAAITSDLVAYLQSIVSFITHQNLSMPIFYNPGIVMHIVIILHNPIRIHETHLEIFNT